MNKKIYNIIICALLLISTAWASVECTDTIDNDGDGLIDVDDLQCTIYDSETIIPRLPVSGSDTDYWGIILNDFLRVSLNENGSLKPVIESDPIFERWLTRFNNTDTTLTDTNISDMGYLKMSNCTNWDTDSSDDLTLNSTSTWDKDVSDDFRPNDLNTDYTGNAAGVVLMPRKGGFPMSLGLVCDTTTEGGIYYNNLVGVFHGCTRTGWKTLNMG